MCVYYLGLNQDHFVISYATFAYNISVASPNYMWEGVVILCGLCMLTSESGIIKLHRASGTMIHKDHQWIINERCDVLLVTTG